MCKVNKNWNKSFSKRKKCKKTKNIMTELKCTSEILAMLETMQNIKWLDLASTPRMQNKVSKDENYKSDNKLRKRKNKSPSKKIIHITEKETRTIRNEGNIQCWIIISLIEKKKKMWVFSVLGLIAF